MAIDAINYKTQRHELENHFKSNKNYNKCISYIADEIRKLIYNNIQ